MCLSEDAFPSASNPESFKSRTNLSSSRKPTALRDGMYLNEKIEKSATSFGEIDDWTMAINKQNQILIDKFSVICTNECERNYSKS